MLINPTKTFCIFVLPVIKNKPLHRKELTQELKRLFPSLFPANITPNHITNLMNKNREIDPNSPFLQLGDGYYSIRPMILS